MLERQSFFHVCWRRCLQIFRCSRGRAWIGIPLILMPLSLPAATVKPCKSDHDGVALTPAQVRNVLAAHRQWTALEFSEQRSDDRRRANLCGAILTGATLNDTDLRGSNLTWST
ncbi:MAG: pentapeptide repeat-containing protein, partial [Burkholderiales bacterium]